MARRMPNASMAKSDWGGMTAPQGTNDPRLNVPGLKHYPIEQVLFFHEKHLHNLMGAVGQLQLDASENSAKASPKVDVEAIKESVKTELSGMLTAPVEELKGKIHEQAKTIVSLRQEIEELRKNLEENVELVVDEA